MATTSYTERDFGDAWNAAGSEAPESEENAKRRASLLARKLTFAQMAAVEAPPAEELLGPLVVRGQRTFIAGHTGEGKTTFSLRMMRAIMAGEEMLGWQGAGAKVMVIDVEQSIRTVHRRMGDIWLDGRYKAGEPIGQAMRAVPGLENSIYWRISEGLALNDASSVDAEVLEEEIAAERPDVILLDPLYKTFIGNPNEAEIAAAVVRLLDRWREEYGFAFVMPVHPRKPPNSGGTFTKHDIFGAGTWIWGAEMVLGIQRKGTNGAMLHFWKDRDGDLEGFDPWILTYDKARGFERVDTGGHELPSQDKLARALAEAAPQWLNRRDLAALTGLASSTVRAGIEKLEKSNYPLRVKPGPRGEHFYTVDVAPDSARYEALVMEDDDAF